jgi:hypothetical protein
MLLSTLRAYVAPLGGELQLLVISRSVAGGDQELFQTRL